MSLEKLKAIVTPPEHPIDASTAEAWPEVERALGTALPRDYKQLVNLYGIGWFANWIYVASPFSKHHPLVDKELLGLITSNYEEYPKAHPPFPGFPNPDGLLPWASDDNGGLFCWLTRGHPDEWVTVNLDNDYSDGYRELQYTTTDLLAGWLIGEIVGDWYPEDVVPARKQVFTPGHRPQ